MRNKILRLEDQVEKERNLARQEANAKKLAHQEIGQLQDLVKEMQKTIEKVTDELQESKQINDDRKGEIKELDTQKRIFEERLQLKDREMESYIQRHSEISNQLAELQKAYDILDEKHVKLRAQEYDKVDVLKVNAELEGKSKNLAIDVENLIRERNRLQDENKALKNDNLSTKDHASQLQNELDYFKQEHEVSMDKFELKFTEFATELKDLTSQNQALKEKERKYKRTINQLEVKAIELEEKYKFANQRNNDLNA